MVQRYKFESKSQQTLLCLARPVGCFQWFKGTNLKANHNYTGNRCSRTRSCFQWFKGTNLKANHNGVGVAIAPLVLFPMVQRYKFESKSQPERDNGIEVLRCFQWFKGTNLKANHNV